MRAAALLLAAQVALSSAFVLPFFNGDVTDKDVGVEMSYSRVVRIGCPDCPADVPSDLLLDFNIAASNPSVVTLNGVPVLSSKEAVSAMGVQAAMVPVDVDIIEYYTAEELFPKTDLDYSLLTLETVMLEEGPYKRDSLELRIAAVGGVPVKINGVAMEVREDLTDGSMMFDNISPIPSNDTCNLDISCLLGKMMDKIKATMGRPLKSFGKPCSGKKMPNLGGMPMPADTAFMEGPAFEPVPIPGHHGPHGMGPNRVHDEAGFLANFISTILVPIFIGIAVGMAFGAIGVVVVHGVVCLARRIKARRAERVARGGCRRRCRGFFRRRRQETELPTQADDADAAKGLLSEVVTEAPPAYVDEGLEVVEKE